MVRTGKRIAAVAIAATLAMSSVASAKQVTFIGKFKGQPDSGLGAKVIFNGEGVPKKLGSFSYSTLEAPCSADPTGNTLLPLSGAYSDPKLKKRGNRYVFKAGGGEGVENGILKGTISKNGKKMAGEVDDSATFGAAGECSIKGAEFTAKPE
jgi:hypothetical protein